jgi:hypothetical protein
MAEYAILYWQDIPSMVEASDGDSMYKAQLSVRFQQLIDLAAMKRGVSGSDVYLDGFHRGERQQRNGSPQAVAEMVQRELEAQYSAIRASILGKTQSF